MFFFVKCDEEHINSGFEIVCLSKLRNVSVSEIFFNTSVNMISIAINEGYTM